VLFIAGTRIPVTTILGLLWGVSTADALAYYPQLVSDDVMACVRYAIGVGGHSEPGDPTRSSHT
jgi:uncharacterized protein (DUF433 family)